MGDFKQEEVDANFTHSSQESFTFSCFSDGSIPCNFDDHELFFDMDVTLPLPWDHIGEKIRSLHSPETQEFEFRMSFSESASGVPGAVSPADELFYKGQLLPLHLPPRLQMVERLSARTESEDEEPDISSVLLSCYRISRDILQGSDRKYSEECEDALPVDTLSCSSHSKSDVDGRSRVSSLGSPWVDYTDRSLQDPYIFPNCYRDPTLQLIGDEAVHGAKFHFSWRKPSLRWKMHTPGSRRSVKVGMEDRNFYTMTPNLRHHQQKEQQKGVSVLKFRAHGSFLKSLFAHGDHQIAGGGKGFPKEGRRTSVYDDDDDDIDHRAAAHEEPMNLQSSRHSPIRKTNFEEGGLLDLRMDSRQQLGFSSSAAKADGYKDLRLMHRARDCLQRYLRMLKPHKSHESDNYLFNPKEISTAAGTPARAREEVPASAFVSKSLLCDLRQEPMEPAGHHHKSIHRFSSSFSRRSRGNGPSNNQSGLYRVFSETQPGNCSRSNCVELENPIKGAIAHCKQSAQAATTWVNA